MEKKLFRKKMTMGKNVWGDIYVFLLQKIISHPPPPLPAPPLQKISGPSLTSICYYPSLRTQTYFRSSLFSTRKVTTANPNRQTISVT